MSYHKKNTVFHSLNRKQKVRYILDYYKGWFFIAFVAVLFLYYIGETVWQSHQIIDLQGFFVNDEHNLFPAKELMEDFSVYTDTPRGHRIAFEDSLFVNLESGTEYHAASQSKIIAYTAAKELDFLVVPRELAEYYARSFVLRDLTSLLPPELAGSVSDDLTFMKDGTGKEKACLLDLRQSRFLAGTPYAEDGYCLLVLDYTGRSEAVMEFIRYAYEKPTEDAVRKKQDSQTCAKSQVRESYFF